MRTTRQPFRVVLYGEFGTENLGNEGSLQVTIDQLRTRLPDADLVAVGVHPEVVSADHQIPAFAMTAPRLPESRLPRFTGLINRATKKLADPLWLVHQFKGLDALVVAGTGIVEDTEALRTWQTPWSLLGAVTAARLRGADVIFCAVGASPPTSRSKRRIFGSALRLATYRSFRDQFSRAAATSTGVAASADPVYPDMCFALDRPVPRSRSGPRRRIGLGVMSYQGDDPDPAAQTQAREQYTSTMAVCTEYLCNRGDEVALLIGESTDRSVAEEVRTRVVRQSAAAASLVSVRAANDLTSLLDQMVDLDVVVATRFHNIVCALHLGLPSLAIVYAPKTRDLMEAVGQGRWCVDAHRVQSEALIDLLDQLLGQRERVQTQIRAATADYPADVHRQFDEVASLLARRNRTPQTAGASR